MPLKRQPSREVQNSSDNFLVDLLLIDSVELQNAIQTLTNLGHKGPKYENDQDVAGTIFSIAGLNPPMCSGIEVGIKIGLIIAESRAMTKAMVN